MARFRNPLMWIYTLASTVIGAVAGAIPVVIVDPEHFNIHEGWEKLTLVMTVSGLLALGNYLKEHPLPDFDSEP